MNLYQVSACALSNYTVRAVSAAGPLGVGAVIKQVIIIPGRRRDREEHSDAAHEIHREV